MCVYNKGGDGIRSREGNGDGDGKGGRKGDVDYEFKIRTTTVKTWVCGVKGDFLIF